MAKSFLTDIQLNRNVLLNPKIHAWGSAPSGTYIPDNPGGANIPAVQGQISSYLGALYIFTGSTGTPANSWVQVGAGTVTSVNGTANQINSTGGSTPTLSLITGYGDSVNPYGSKTANFVLAAPNGSNNTPSFRALVAADIPTAINITGSAGSLTNGLGLTSGGNLAFSSGTTFNGGTSGITIGLSTTPTGITSINTVTMPTSGSFITSATTALPNVLSVNGTNIPSGGATLLTSTSTSSALTSVGTLNGLTIASTQTVSMGSNRVRNVATPTEATDAATKGYVDTSIANTQAGFNVHTAVRVATTANLTGTYTGGSTDASQGVGIGATFVFATGQIDLVDLVANDRVLLKNQTNQVHNGIYAVTGTPGANVTLTRTADFDNSIAGEVFPGDLVYVTSGTTNGGSTWAMNATGTATTPVGAIRIGTDNIVWVQFAGTTGGVLPGSQGGTGVANTGRTITLGGNLTTTTAAISLAASGSGSTVTLPTTGTLATLAGSEALTNKTYNGLTVSGSAGTLTIPTGATLVTSGANSITLTSTGATNVTLPTSGTLLSNPASVSSNPGTSLAIAAGTTTSTALGAGGGALTLTGGNSTSASSEGGGGTVTIRGGGGSGSGGYGGSVIIGGGSGGALGDVHIGRDQGGTALATNVRVGAASVTTTITGVVLLPTVANSTAGFVKTASDGTLSRAGIVYSDLPTSSLTGVTTDGIARKKTGLGSGTSTNTFSINHGFGQWVIAQLHDSSGNQIEVDIQNTSTSNGTTIFTFAANQTNMNVYQYVIIG
jgi:hypothetical protein